MESWKLIVKPKDYPENWIIELEAENPYFMVIELHEYMTMMGVEEYTTHGPRQIKQKLYTGFLYEDIFLN